MNKKQIILIGGAPTTGKSTMAMSLAKELGLPWISTDQIRDTMRVVASKTEHPNLFNDGFDAETFLSTFSAQQIVDKEFIQSEAAWLGIRAFIENDYTWPSGFIIEGVNILPHLVAADFSGRTDIKTVFLVDHDEDRMRKVVFGRGLWANADEYPDSVKEKEVAWAKLFSQKLELDAKKHNYPWVEIHKNSDDVARVLAAINQ